MRKRVISIVIAVVSSAFVSFAPSVSASVNGSCSSGVSGDFNGDGFDDVAVGSPLGDTDAVTNAGTVNIIYGSETGLNATMTPAQIWFQGLAGSLGAGTLAGAAEASDRFGACLAAGDFDGDDNSDLAVGVPGEDIGSIKNTGAVNVIYGSASGLVSSGNQLLSQSGDFPDEPEPSDRFGTALSAGDFDGDGKDDLAVGVPFESVGGAAGAGAVNVMYGTATGLKAARAQFWAQGVNGLPGRAETDDHFGLALASGDFNAKGRDALAIGAPGEDIYQREGRADEGVVQVVYSDATDGLRATGSQLWHEAVRDVKGSPRPGDAFGASLAGADFNNDSFDDLAVGVPLKDFSTAADAGAVNVIYGSATRLDVANNQLFKQGTGGVVGKLESGDHFGATLTAADFDGDSNEDLAIGVPTENFGANDDGAMNAIYGSPSGLDASIGSQVWTQGPGSAGDASEAGDNMGASLTAGNFDTGPIADVMVGVPDEDFASKIDAGQALTLYGSASGLSGSGKQLWNEDSANVPGTAASSDGWAFALG